MPRNWPGLGERIQQRIAALGFKNPAQFADAKGYRITYIYKWAAGTTPDRANLERLAKDLEVHPAWLLFGDEIRPLVRSVKKALACLLAATAIGGVLVAPASAHLGDAAGAQTDERHYVNLRRRRYRPWWRQPCRDNSVPLQEVSLSGFPRLTLVRG